MGKRMEAVTLSLLIWASALTPFFGQNSDAAGESAQPASQPVRVLFLNVGKADAALFMLGDKRYLIDTGTKDSADALLRALHYFEVTALDGAIITHTDSDHVGGLKALLKSDIPVAQLYASAFYNTKTIEKHPVYKQAEKYQVPLSWVGAGDEIAVSEGFKFTALGPLSLDPTNENNNSLVLRLTTPQGEMLLTGDMEVPEETELLGAGLIQPAAVLKVGHHGDGDASSAAFLYSVKPQIAVISTNSLAEMDTPDAAVMGRLWNIGAEVFVTQKATCGVQVTLKDGVAVGKLVHYPLP